MMKCGHAANAIYRTKDGEEKPSCAICAGITPLAEEIADTPHLTGRKASCALGNHAIVDSSTNLAFFQHCPDKDHDIYYCGCYGWD